MPYRRLKTGDRTGEYLLEEKIGEGPDAEVWRARHHVLVLPARVKVAVSEAGAGALQSAGVAQHTIRHPRVARILGLNLENDPPYLVTEYVDGESLRSLLGREGALPWKRFGPVIQDVLEGLEAVHQAGKVHGNLKPENVLVEAGGRTTLMDFGAPDVFHAGDDLLSGVLTGKEGSRPSSAPYLPPERKDGGSPTPGGDLWAAGLMLFEAVTGKLPVGSEAPSDLVRNLPPEVDRAFRRAFAGPERRFGSAGEMAADLFPEVGAVEPREEVTVLSARATCSACGGLNRIEYRHCIHCGSVLGRWDRGGAVCGECGKPRLDPYRFCPYCGARHGGGDE